MRPYVMYTTYQIKFHITHLKSQLCSCDGEGNLLKNNENIG